MTHAHKIIWWLLCVLGALVLRLQAQLLRAIND